MCLVNEGEESCRAKASRAKASKREAVELAVENELADLEG